MNSVKSMANLYTGVVLTDVRYDGLVMRDNNQTVRLLLVNEYDVHMHKDISLCELTEWFEAFHTED